MDAYTVELRQHIADKVKRMGVSRSTLETLSTLEKLSSAQLQKLVGLPDASLKAELEFFHNGGYWAQEGTTAVPVMPTPAVAAAEPVPVVAVAPTKPAERETNEWSIDEMLASLDKDDPRAILNASGNYLGLGMSLLINAATGAGKSAGVIQMAVFWACAVAFFGMAPIRALTTLILQNENCQRDAAEALDGAIRYCAKVTGMDIEAVKAAVRKHVIFRRRHWTGDAVAELTRVELAALRKQGINVDVVTLDPLLGFFGAIGEPKEAQRWLYDLMTPMILDEQILLVLPHHIPLRSVGKRGNGTNNKDSVYDGFGGIILPGWARATIGINRSDADPDVFEWSYGKRGERLGEGAKSIYHIRHSTEYIEVNGKRRKLVYWEECAAPVKVDAKAERRAKQEQVKSVKAREDKEEERQAQYKKSRAVFHRFEADTDIKSKELQAAVKEIFGVGRAQCFNLIEQLIDDGWFSRGEAGGYRRNEAMATENF